MKKILIIENDRNIALALSLRLKSAGCEAITAYNVLPAGMPRAPTLSGPGASGHLDGRRQRLFRGPGNSDAGSDARARHLSYRQPQNGFREQSNEPGVAEYVEKPYQAEDLLAPIQNALYPNPMAPVPKITRAYEKNTGRRR